MLPLTSYSSILSPDPNAIGCTHPPDVIEAIVLEGVPDIEAEGYIQDKPANHEVQEANEK